MRYNQITPAERYTWALLLKQAPELSQAAIARIMQRHPSTISRELKRNRATHDGAYRWTKAQEKTNGRRRRSRRNSHFTEKEWSVVDALLAEKFSPEQVSGWLRLLEVLDISHETIYTPVWKDKHRGGSLWRHLRQPFKAAEEVRHE